MIIVMGLPGAGKSTLLKSLQAKLSDYTFLNYGDLMFEIEKEKNWVQNRDEMRKLPIEKQKQVQELVAKKLSKEKGKVLLDTHCAVSTPNGYYPGLPFSFLKGLTVEKLIYVTASVQEIIQRRQNDSTRVRDVDNVAEHDDVNKNFLAAYSAFTGAPCTIIHNKEGKLDESVEKMMKLL
ncbi:MAG: adenylate kinase [Candidatus Micrarchaeota archaeon]